ncbi:MAG: hypothetical protein HRU19_28045 [Pseudobacteriovorax sp.]|nr:hypothetical protein [Pseudobacteriovorax sp.]
MGRMFFSSDVHFFHKNILRYDEEAIREHLGHVGSIYHYNELIIARWNELVAPEDQVYFLGDFSFGSRGESAEILHRLHGVKTVVRGNHDPDETLLRDMGFSEIHDSLFVNYKDQSLYLSHFPVKDLYQDIDAGNHNAFEMDVDVRDKKRATRIITKWAHHLFDCAEIMATGDQPLLVCGHVHGLWQRAEFKGVSMRNVGLAANGYRPVGVDELRRM